MKHLKAESFKIPDLRHIAPDIPRPGHLLKWCAAVSPVSTKRGTLWKPLLPTEAIFASRKCKNVTTGEGRERIFMGRNQAISLPFRNCLKSLKIGITSRQENPIDLNCSPWAEIMSLPRTSINITAPSKERYCPTAQKGLTGSQRVRKWLNKLLISAFTGRKPESRNVVGVLNFVFQDKRQKTVIPGVPFFKVRMSPFTLYFCCVSTNKTSYLWEKH